MDTCRHEKKCAEYLRGERKLEIDPPITEKPECDFLGCQIFQELEIKSYRKFLDSPLCKAINKELEEQGKEAAKTVNKVLQKTKKPSVKKCK